MATCPDNTPCDPCMNPDPCNPSQPAPLQLDAGAVFYHKDGCTTSKLGCLGLPNGTPVEVVLEKIDEKLCQATNTYTYTAYNLSCLKKRYVIGNHQQFVEAVDKEFCRLQAVIDQNYLVLNGRIDSLSTVVQGILYPKITNRCGLAFNDQSSIQRILQVLADKICALSSPQISSLGPAITANDSASIAFSATGELNHVLQASVKISAAGGNILTLKPDGLHVPTTVIPNQTQTLVWDPITRRLTISGGNVVTIDQAPPQTLSFSCNTKILSLSNGGAPVDLSCLVPPSFSETDITIVPSNSMVINTSGIAKHTLFAEVKLDPTPGNAISVSSNGLYVSTVSNTPITKIDSQSIAITVSGQDSHQISANLVVSTQAGNAVQVLEDGVFVPTSTETPNSTIPSDTATVALAGPFNRQICVNVKIDPNPANALSSSSAGLFVEAPGEAALNRFGIEDNTGIQDRYFDAAGFDLQMTNVKTVYFTSDRTDIGATAGLYATTLDGITRSRVSAGDGTDQIDVVITPTEVAFNNKVGSLTFITPAVDRYSPVSVNNVFADSSGNITLDLSGTIVPTFVVNVATTTALPASTYNNGTSGVGATLTADSNGTIPDIDGFTPIVGSKILVKDQADATQNGPYIVTDTGDGSSPFILTRVTNADQTSELYPQVVSVSQGTLNAGNVYEQDTPDPVVGTDDIIYGPFSVSYFSETWQKTLINGSTLTQNNTVNASSFSWTFNSTGLYNITTPSIRFASFTNTTGKILSTDSSGNLVLVDAAAITLAPIGSTPNANGASLSSGTFNLQPASASFGGVVTTIDQTFNGVKTFAPTVSSTVPKGTIFSPVLNAGANIDQLSGIYINPSFNPGPWSQVTNWAIRHSGNIGPITNNIESLGNFSFRYLAASATTVNTDNIKVLASSSQPLTFMQWGGGIMGKYYQVGNLHLQTGNTTDFGYRLFVDGTSAIGAIYAQGWITTTKPNLVSSVVSFNSVGNAAASSACYYGGMFIPSGGAGTIGSTTEFINFHALTQTYDRGTSYAGKLIGFKADINWRAGTDVVGGVTDGIYGFYAKVGTIWANSPFNDVPKAYSFYGVAIASSIGRIVEAGHICLERINPSTTTGATPFGIKQLGTDNINVFEGNTGIGVVPNAAARLKIAASTVNIAQINLATGPAPTSPADGDMWREDNTNTGLKFRVNGVTKTVSLV